MGKSKYPLNFVAAGSYLTFIGQLTAASKIGGKQIHPLGFYNCRCGKQTVVQINNAKTGAVKSCGCLPLEKPGYTTHGLHDHPLYPVWQKIKYRCYKCSDPAYPQYGGRGVRMCDEWLKHPEKFIQWGLEKGWKKGFQVDKDIISKRMGIAALLYSPTMCCLVTSKENNNARRNNRIVEYKGETKSLLTWSEILGINFGTLYRRLYIDKWTPEKAFETPLYLSRFKFKNKQE